MLRAAYMKAMGKRMRAAASVVRKTVYENDALYLSDKRLPLTAASLPAKRYDFPSGAGKYPAFLEWLRDLFVVEILDGSTAWSPGHWQNIYVTNAYTRGVERAINEMERAGISQAFLPQLPLPLPGVAVPINARALEILSIRNYELLKGITDSMAAQIQETLTAGVLEGINPLEMARRMTRRIGIGLNRARTIARTEVIRSFNEANLDTYEQYGVRGVTASVEFSTAGDSRVCQRCAGLQGTIVSVAQARGVIPVHPNCRCTWLPVLETLTANRWNLYGILPPN